MANILQASDSNDEAGRGPSEELERLGARWPIRALVLVGSVPGNLAVVIPRPQLPAIEADLGGGSGNDLLIKMILTVVGVSIVLFSPFVGMAIRAAGHRAVIGIGLLLFVSAGIAPYFLSNLYILVGTRILLGLAMAAIQICALALMGELYRPSTRARMIGLMTAASASSAVIMGPMSGVVGEGSWRYAFLLYGVLAPFVLFAWFGLPARIIPKPLPIHRSGSHRRAHVPLWIVVLGVLGGFAMTLPAVFLTFRFKEIGIGSSAVIGLSFLALSIPEVVASSAYGWFRRRLSVTAIAVGAFFAAAAGASLAAMAPTYELVLVGVGLIGVSIAGIFSSLAERATGDEKQRARLLGLFYSAIYIAAIGGTVAFEPIFQAFGASGVLLSLAGTASLSILFLLGERWSRAKATSAATGSDKHGDGNGSSDWPGQQCGAKPSADAGAI